jgi:hypothetical protein
MERKRVVRDSKRSMVDLFMIYCFCYVYILYLEQRDGDSVGLECDVCFVRILITRKQDWE